MLNYNCQRENQARISQKIPSLLTPDEAAYEASRCLGALSCEACDICRVLCPDLAITRDTITGQIIIDLDYCKGCGICAWVCPKGAITMVVGENL